MTQKAMVKVTYKALAAALKFPDNIEIVDVLSEREDRTNDMIALKVVGDTLPETIEGQSML